MISVKVEDLDETEELVPLETPDGPSGEGDGVISLGGFRDSFPLVLQKY